MYANKITEIIYSYHILAMCTLYKGKVVYFLIYVKGTYSLKT